ncbi:DUF2268 domain-containing protein [Bacillus sp. FJAT-29790]|nr:DUF2268 domain-containing protein [Bacillus sp. FJAT-29790]
MYKPNRQSFETFEQLKKRGIWEKTEKIFQKYKKKWNGPDIPIYIFPIESQSFFFSRPGERKSGVSFKDQLFLFITTFEDEMELEALFVHEYHHVCRMNKQKESLLEFTLLDSLVLEGLAEHAVETCCGKQYKAKWCSYYSRKEIQHFWQRFLEKEQQITKKNKKHDEILYGNKGYPKMVGYAAGYEMVSIFKEKRDFTIKESFVLPSKTFIIDMNKNER